MILRLVTRWINNLRKEKKRRFNRVLPINELISDRWEKARFLGFGENASIHDTSFVYGNVKVGNNTWIGPFTVLDGSGYLTIGNNCSVSAGVQVYTHDSVKWAISGGSEKYECAPTTIGNNVYIGPNTIIAKGVNIGDCTIIGANSFVNKSFDGNCKIAGSPAKLI